jgi:hypothetical protein
MSPLSSIFFLFYMHIYYVWYSGHKYILPIRFTTIEQGLDLPETLTHTWYTYNLPLKCEFVCLFEYILHQMKDFSSIYTCTVVDTHHHQHTQFDHLCHEDIWYNKLITFSQIINFDHTIVVSRESGGSFHRALRNHASKLDSTCSSKALRPSKMVRSYSIRFGTY